MRVLLAMLIAAFGFAALADMPAPQGRVLVTVGGDLPEGNMPPGHEDDVGFFGFLDLNFATAVGFDDAALAAMEQGQITLAEFGAMRDVTFTGPYLAAVMTAAGAAERTAKPVALDGYQVDITWDNQIGLRPILATHANGRPLGLGGFGPATIIYPPQKDAALQEELDALQVWAVAFIGVE